SAFSLRFFSPALRDSCGPSMPSIDTANRPPVTTCSGPPPRPVNISAIAPAPAIIGRDVIAAPKPALPPSRSPRGDSTRTPPPATGQLRSRPARRPPEQDGTHSLASALAPPRIDRTAAGRPVSPPLLAVGSRCSSARLAARSPNATVTGARVAGAGWVLCEEG